MQLKNKWAFVTGATAGIGWATAEILASRGCHLFITGRREQRLNTLAQTLRERHQVEVVPLAFDIRDFANTRDVLSGQDLARTSILINNAGLAVGKGPLQEQKFEDWQVMIETNVTGLLSVTKLVLPFLLKNSESHLINLGSVAGRWVYQGGAVYCATKFAVRALSDGLRLDLMGKPIRVTNIEPGMAETEFSQVRFAGNVAEAKKVYQGMTPLTAQDIAETIVWCLERPQHVNIAEVVIYPTDQAGVGVVHRRS